MILLCRYQSLLCQDGQHVGGRLAIPLLADGLVAGEQMSIIGKQLLHILIIDAGDGIAAFLISIGIDDIAAETVQLVTAKPDGCRDSIKGNTRAKRCEETGHIGTKPQKERAVVDVIDSNDQLVTIIRIALYVV